jgi:hypothetical protein
MVTSGAPAQLHLAGHLVDAITSNAMKCGAPPFQLKARVIPAVIVKPKAQKQQARD